MEQFIVNHIEYTLARSRFNIDDFAAYSATAYSVRDRLIEFWNDAQQYARDKEVKMVYYMSIEFLLGRSLQNAVTNLGLKDEYGRALNNLGWKLEDLYETEQDAALGNGGLGRLAACFLDSLATLDLPAWGYGIRYQYGMFKQSLHNGFQVEMPDYWLGSGNPWEVRRPDKTYPVRYYGTVREVVDADGNWRMQWEGGQMIQAIAYDMPIPGYGTLNVSNLRLWDSRPSDEFDLNSFNSGDYYGAIKQKQESENICSVLYPNDNTPKGRELRLKQQYFFVSASLQDMLRRFKRDFPSLPVTEFHTKAAIQLNDTHPSISIAELMRLLLDVERCNWDDAWNTTTKTFAYTNHTVLPEALEKWELGLFEALLPRHAQIIYEINHRFLEYVAEEFPGDVGKLQRMSLIEESNPKKIRMAHLACVGSHSINGVAAIHTQIIKDRIFPDFFALWPKKFNNKTNGVTPRRWLDQANPGLSDLLTKFLGNDDWITQLDKVSDIKRHANNPDFQARFAAVKFECKVRLAELIEKATDGHVKVNPHALFDVQVKVRHY
jgi:glycogen phosphorylase